MTTTTTTRSPRGQGSVGRFHNHPTCPPSVKGVRPEHRCRGLWRARVTVVIRGRKTNKTVYGKSQDDVNAKLKVLRASEAEGRVPLNGKKPTVAVWMERWYAEGKPRWAINTWQNYRRRMDRWILPNLGTIRLDRLSGDDIEGLYAQMRSQDLHESSIQQVHCILHRALAVARKRRLIQFNPCDDVEAPSQKPRKPRRPLTVEEAWRVIEVAQAEGNVRPILALMTGLRPREATALRWSDLKLDGTPSMKDPHLVVDQACSHEVGVGWKFHEPKTDASTGRLVPLVPDLVRMLKKAKAEALLSGAAPDGLLFPGRRPGDPISAAADLIRWHKALDRAGVERTQLHAARNTVAGLLESAGVPDRVVAVILGHSDVSMTHHYQEGNVRGVTEAFASLDAYMKDHRGGAAA